MSHGRERHEKNCLNCGATVLGRYCQVCGQENIEPKESFWSMLRHFLEDITHFDGKFFTTIKDLFVRPGFLSAEYIRGRRMSYLHPVRMYVFTSAIFFLVFFALTKTGEGNLKMPNDDELTLAQRDSMATPVQRRLKKKPDDINLQKQFRLLTDTAVPLRPSMLLPYMDWTFVTTLGRNYKSRREYDSIQQALPADERDGWFEHLWNKRATTLNDKYKYKQEEGGRKMIDGFLHRLPYMLFVSLPFFALVLNLLYIRRKNFYYADHGIFSIHHYILSFLLILLAIGFDKLQALTKWDGFEYLTAASVLAVLVYLYLAMKKFYRQSRLKTFFKFFLLNISGFLLIVLLMLIFFLFSVFEL